MPDVRLRVNGCGYGGWKSVRVTRGIESIAGGFELGYADRWPGQASPWPIRDEDECTLTIDGEPVIVGYIDRPARSFDAESRTLTVSGRDRTGALVDCSAVPPAWEFRQIPLLTLARRIADQFGIPVSLQPGLTPPSSLAKFSIDPGETAFDALSRACAVAGLLPIADGRGGLVLARAGSAQSTTELVEGKNIMAAADECDASGRFRTYRVLGQHAGSDEFSGPPAASVKATALDAGVRRSERVLLVRADGNVTTTQAQTRAQWEATVRAARAYTARVTLQGWRQDDGSLWRENMLVRIRSPYLGLDAEMLISEVVFSLDDSAGTTTQLTLVRPDAFLPEPVIEPTVARGRKGKKGSAPWAELAGGVSVPDANFSTPDGRAVKAP